MCVCVIKTKFSPAAFCQPENAANALHCATHPTDVSCSLTWPRVRIVLLRDCIAKGQQSMPPGLFYYPD